MATTRRPRQPVEAGPPLSAAPLRPPVAIPSRSGEKTGDTVYGIRSIGLAFAILENLIAGNRGKGASELARELGTNKWRVFRHLHALRECGYVTQDPETDRFDVSFRLFELAIAIPRRLRLIDIARPAMTALRRQIGHSVLLAVVNQTRVMIIDGLSGDDPVQLVVVPGSQLDMHSSALGKVALAFGPPELLEQILTMPLPKHTPLTITEPALLRREIAAVRERGWASSTEERHRGVGFIAAPVFSAVGRFIAAIGFMFLGDTRTLPGNDEIAALTTAAGQISAQLGGSGQ